MKRDRMLINGVCSLFIAQVLLIMLKLSKFSVFSNISWGWILSPLWIPLTFTVIIMVLIAIFAFIYNIVIKEDSDLYCDSFNK